MQLLTVYGKHSRGLVNVLTEYKYEDPNKKCFTDFLHPKMMNGCTQ